MANPDAVGEDRGMVMPRMRVHRHAWLVVLAVGVFLNIVVLATLIATENPNFVPALILLGAAVVPATFLTFAAGRTVAWAVSGGVLGFTALFGGVIGIVAAGWLEYDTLRAMPWLGVVGVGLIEEAAKLLVPAVLLVALWRRRGGNAAVGLLVGIASGLGFAVLETMGYAFVTLIQSGGNLGDVEQVLFTRGVMSPAGHTAWAGLTCAALWAAYIAPTTRRWLAFAATFAAVVVLHALWDGLNSYIGYLVVGAVSAGWLLWRIHRLHRRPVTA
jgi:RsiW-degrading membrane proteinase PrsW (M82 family)